jgi:hypothetical protein
MDRRLRLAAAWWLGLAVALLTTATLAPAIQCGFTNWDDPDYVIHNHLLRDLSPGGIRTIAGAFVQGNYHPVTILSLAADYRLGKLNPAVYHRTNIILHVLATLAVFWLIFLMTGSSEMSAIASVLRVHPVHVESSLVSAEDVLCPLLFRSVLAYVRGFERDGGSTTGARSRFLRSPFFRRLWRSPSL